MPKASLETPEAPVEEVLEDEEQPTMQELIDEVEEELAEEKKPRQRKIFHEDNKFVFPLGDDEEQADCLKTAKAGIKDLKYTDLSPVEGVRVFRIMKDVEFDEETGDETAGEFIAAVLARSSDVASRMFLEDQGITADLAFKKKRGGGGGRGKYKVEETGLMYGKLLESVLFKGGKEANGFKPDASEGHKKDWNEMYAKGGRLGHYRNEDGSWKDPTS